MKYETMCIVLSTLLSFTINLVASMFYYVFTVLIYLITYPSAIIVISNNIVFPT